jgi:peptidyl-prolyl cis-trans isomerase A (cyclophilin A)
MFRLGAVAACSTAFALLTACGGGGGSAGDSGTALATVTSATVSNPLYSQTAVFTVNGANLDKGLTVTSAGCKAAPSLSTAAPNISTASTAYYTCTVGAVGAQTAAIARSSDGAALTSVAYAVDVPQVTLTLGGPVAGNVVITLEPVKAPITTDNFLAYIKSGFYVGTAFHRLVSSFVLQGGAYVAPITATATPVARTPNANIALEVGKLSNVKYTLAMARGSDANSANSQFFFNLVDNIGLDTNAGGYAVFGTVTSGMALVDQLALASCTVSPFLGNFCVPIPNITITAATQTR